MSVGELLFDKLPGTDGNADEASAWQVGDHSRIPHNMLALSGPTALAGAGESELLLIASELRALSFRNCRLCQCGGCVTYARKVFRWGTCRVSWQFPSLQMTYITV